MRITLYRLTLILSLALASGSPVCLAEPTASAVPGSITIAPASITYFARQGDTLSSIAKEFTTRQDNWPVLAKLNNVGKDKTIPVGAGILIPAELLADEPSEATVLAQSGNITVKKPDGAAGLVRVGDKLVEGMQIHTGNNGFLTLSLPDASRITLPSNSRVKLAKLRTTRYTKSPRTELLLLDGRVESRVSPLESNHGSFEVRSTQSVAGVRGTHFRVGVTENGVANEVLSGKVAVGNLKHPEALTLVATQGNIINGESVGPAVELLPAPQLAGRGVQANYPSAQFSLAPVNGARAYRVQITTDQDAQNVVAENYSADNRLDIKGVANGKYYVRVSAIDRSGLEGLTETHPFTLKAGNESSSKSSGATGAPFVDQSSDKEITLKWPPQSGHKYLLQVAHDPEFTWLVFKAKTTSAQTQLPRPAFGTYYARVKSINADGSDNAFSPVQAFVVTDQWVINGGNPVGARQTHSGAAR